MSSPPTRLSDEQNADIIDCDVHIGAPPSEILHQHLDPLWQERLSHTGFTLDAPQVLYPPLAPTTGSPAGGALTLEELQTGVFRRPGVNHAVVNCYAGVETPRNPDLASALAAAVNDWIIAEFLEHDSRLRGSIVVPLAIEGALREVNRVGQHVSVVQVLLPARAALYGNRAFHPLLETISQAGLVLGLHFGGLTGIPPTPSGWPSYYIEEYAGMAQVFQSQVTSLVGEGALDRFPNLRVALLEAGWTWLPALMWRLDKEWKGVRREIPWVRQLPSIYIRDQVRLSVQPLDAPPGATKLLHQFYCQLESDDLLMFSSDYPHRHSQLDPLDELSQLLLNGLSIDQRLKILSENARRLYQLS